MCTTFALTFAQASAEIPTERPGCHVAFVAEQKNVAAVEHHQVLCDDSSQRSCHRPRLPAGSIILASISGGPAGGIARLHVRDDVKSGGIGRSIGRSVGIRT